jgi:hypothetical protein
MKWIPFKLDSFRSQKKRRAKDSIKIDWRRENKIEYLQHTKVLFCVESVFSIEKKNSKDNLCSTMLTYLIFYKRKFSNLLRIVVAKHAFDEGTQLIRISTHVPFNIKALNPNPNKAVTTTVHCTQCSSSNSHFNVLIGFKLFSLLL